MLLGWVNLYLGNAHTPKFHNLTHLTELSLEHNQLSQSPNFNLPNLAILDISNNQLDLIPNYDLPNLIELDLSDNHLPAVPNFNLPNLTSLNIASNQLLAIPNFDSLISLAQLDLSNNHLTTVPNFNNLLNLIDLSLQSNQLVFGELDDFLTLSHYTYSSQDSICTYHPDGNLYVTVGGTPAQNTYHWYQYGHPTNILDIKTGDSTFTWNTPGYYYCRVINQDLPSLTLTSKVAYLEPICNVVLTLADSLFLCPSDSLNASIGTMQVYEWSFNGSIISQTRKSPIIGEGNYALRVRDQCFNWAYDTVLVQLDYDCVLPGDANADGSVDPYDILQWGLCYGVNDIPRSNGHTGFQPQACEPWALVQQEVNAKHSDCNGDGIVNLQDSHWIEHYANGAPPVLSSNTDGPLRILASAANEPNEDGTIDLDIKLENIDQTGISVYGIAYYATINAITSSPTYLNIYPDSWLGDATELIGLVYYLDDSSSLAVARTRVDNQEATAVTSGNVDHIIMIEDVDTNDSLRIFSIELKGVRMTTDGSGLVPGERPVAIDGSTTYIAHNDSILFSVTPFPPSCHRTGNLYMAAQRRGAHFTYAWSNGQNVDSISSSDGVSANVTPGYYSISVTDNYGYQIILDSILVEGVSPLEAQIVQNSNGNIATTLVSGGTPPYYYSWNVGNTSSHVNMTISGGLYVVTVTDAEGCTTLATTTAPDQPIFQVPPVILDGGGPTRKELQFTLPEPSAIFIGLYNTSGQLVWQNKTHTDTINQPLPLDGLSTGVYIVQVQSRFGQWAERIVITQ